MFFQRLTSHLVSIRRQWLKRTSRRQLLPAPTATSSGDGSLLACQTPQRLARDQSEQSRACRQVSGSKGPERFAQLPGPCWLLMQICEELFKPCSTSSPDPGRLPTKKPPPSPHCGPRSNSVGLQSWRPTIFHEIPATQRNANADVLSRYPVEVADPEDPDTQWTAGTVVRPATIIPDLPVTTVTSVNQQQSLVLDSKTNIQERQAEDPDLSAVRHFVERQAPPSVLENVSYPRFARNS
ncbi:hypothetical protein ElyMa_004214000 [Elysia marginata]|uniref:Uncharacterized protein n=1 Tax=Elysia marginata TaxID=1093978 RepID=A0AAV4GPU3_9GAST|nr:hypothetical protein ElyMa_004214000 [Elysia marginata]